MVKNNFHKSSFHFFFYIFEICLLYYIDLKHVFYCMIISYVTIISFIVIINCMLFNDKKSL